MRTFPRARVIGRLVMSAIALGATAPQLVYADQSRLAGNPTSSGTSAPEVALLWTGTLDCATEIQGTLSSRKDCTPAQRAHADTASHATAEAQAIRPGTFLQNQLDELHVDWRVDWRVDTHERISNKATNEVNGARSKIVHDLIHGLALERLNREYRSADGATRETFTTDRQQTARDANSWFSFDKVQHVTFSFLFTLAHQYTLVNKLDMSEDRALPLSLAGTAAIGVGKEIVDWKIRSGRHFDHRDLVADSVGMLLAVGLILL